MKETRNPTWWAGTMSLGVAGALFLGIALAVSGVKLEALAGASPSELTWGPLLFRGLLAFHGLLLVGLAGWRVSRGNATRFAGAKPYPGATAEAALSSRRRWLQVLVLCGFALGLRVAGLDSGLWLDEVFTLVDFARLPFAEIMTSFPTQNQHMLYSILAHASILLLGEGVASLRLPAVLFGVASVWALYLLGRRVSGHREALFACALMTFSYHHIWFSQNARGYTGLLFFAVLSTWLWLQAVSANAARWWLCYSAALVLGLWVHVTMVFVVATHMVVHATELLRAKGVRPGNDRSVTRAGFWRPIGAWFVAATVCLNLYALSLPEFLRSAIGEESLASEWTSPGWVLREAIFRMREAGFGALLVMAGAVALTVGWIDIFRQDRRVALLFALPALLGAATMLASGHNLWPRFFFFAMGFALLIAVRGAMVLPRIALERLAGARFPGLVANGGVALIAAVLVVSMATVPRCYLLPKQDFVGARDFVEGELEEGDAAIAVGLAGEVFSRHFAPDWPAPSSLEELKALRRNHARVWLVYTLPIHMRVWHPEIWQTIQEDFELVRLLPGSLGDGEVYVTLSRRSF